MKQYFLEITTGLGDEYESDLLTFNSLDEIQSYRESITILSKLEHMGVVNDMNKEEQFDLLSSLGFSSDHIEKYTAQELITESYGVMLFDDGDLFATDRSYRCFYGEEVRIGL